MMISTDLNQYVLSFCDNINNTSSIFKLARRKEISNKLIDSYIANLGYLFKENAIHIQAAARIYSSHSSLSNFFHEKWKEEVGHDKWANNDLAKRAHSRDSIEILPEMKDLTNFLYSSMKSNPHNYIAYMYFAELMTSILGPIWFKLINLSIKIDKRDITSLTNHIELDGNHATEVGFFLDSLLLNDKDLEQIIHFYDNLSKHYINFFNALVNKNGTKFKSTNRNALELSTIS